MSNDPFPAPQAETTNRERFEEQAESECGGRLAIAEQVPGEDAGQRR